jgi:GT2 family glycosyltransferase
MSIDNKGYAIERGKKAVEDALKRRKIKATVYVHDKVPYYWIEYTLPKKKPLVSIIIPTRDYADITEACLKSVYEKTTYDNFEIILANNNSEKKETFELFKKYQKKYNNFKVIDINTEFNFSNINNVAIKESKGKYLILLNNDTTVITPNWIELMLGYAIQKHVGTVGVKLLYPDNTVQHAGVILGLGGVASHAFLNSSRIDVGLYGRLSVPYDYSANTAACIMIDRSKYDEVNGLEENLKVAYNDIDFNLKLLKKGYYNVLLPMVELYHYESKSRGLDTTSEKYKRFLEEQSYMFNKWGELIKNDPFYNKNLSLKFCYMLDKKKKK